MAELLRAEGLTVEMGGRRILDGVDLAVAAGATVALVGASGSGKTTLLRACLGLLPAEARVQGKLMWQEGDATAKDLLRMAAGEWRRFRGRKVAMIPQEPAAALDMRRTVGSLLRECGVRDAARALEQVGIAGARAGEYAFQWSGGMQQRGLVAMALARGPQLLLADEATSALDPLQQARLMELMAELRRPGQFAVVWVTHDLALAAQVADEVVVLEAGRVVEAGRVRAVFGAPQQAYTRELIAGQPAWA